MAAPPSNGLQAMLKTAVQTVQWTYSLFWQLCPQQGVLVWGDGYYNGAIKTRKTVQPMEVSPEEASLQRSKELRELYHSLNNHPTPRPSAALLPEDLTESEWFYLMCVSFSFPPGVGLPGKAYAKHHHLWLTGANEMDSKVFTRAILAKSAGVQTVVCIPLLDGVVELGTTERVQEDHRLIQQVKRLFIEHHSPKPALSEYSTSNPSTSSRHPLAHPILDEEEADPSELKQVDTSEDIRLGSPLSDGSNNLVLDFHLLAVSQAGNPADHQQRADSYPTESTHWWPPTPIQDPLTNNLQPSYSEGPPIEESTQEDSHYCDTVSTILHHQCSEQSSTGYLMYSTRSAFTTWSTTQSHHHHDVVAAQCLLKYVLFTVPFLHAKSGDSASRFPQDELGANHVLAERRRREKLNERFIILRSLVPFVTKMDKASILGDTIEYVKQLRQKIQDLEVDPRSRLPGTRKMRIVEGIGGGATAMAVAEEALQVEVSIIESDALVEVQSPYREGLMIDVMQKLREIGVEITTVQSSLSNGVFVAEMRAKVNENVSGKKVSIMEVKRAMNQILPL